jgi:UDP-N-acetylmuramoyl-tripeptide--D-alanyl-D-alanine ligase
LKALTLNEVVEAMRGRTAVTPPVLNVSGVSTDSRTVRPGHLFFAIKGERFDGHDFVKDAFEHGATAAVVSRRELFDAGLGRPIIWVRDTVQALGALASYHRDQIAATVIAVTGSNGKTTTREMIHHLLSGRFRGSQAPKSYNNQIGVPLTLLSAGSCDEFLVVELGSNRHGEIQALAKAARPDIGVIVSIGPAHLEGFGNITAVMREKTSLLKEIRPGGLAVLNTDCLKAGPDLPEHTHLKVISFGESPGADVRLTEFEQNQEGIRFQYNGRFDVSASIPGRHNAVNALAAVVVAKRFGMSDDDIAERLRTFRLPEMRLQRIGLGDVEVILDAYNANPSSVAAALDVLDAMQSGRRHVLVIGDMAELGAESEALHRSVGRRISTARVDVLVTVGRRSEAIAEECKGCMPTHTYEDTTAASEALDEWLKPGDLVMIKGSRTMMLETIVDKLRGRRAACSTIGD